MNREDSTHRQRAAYAKAAEMADDLWTDMEEGECQARVALLAHQLRALASAPQGDVFERVAAEWHDIPYKQKILAALLRERFGPVVEFAKVVASTSASESQAAEAEHALARLAGQPARSSEQALLRLGEQSSPSPAGEEAR